MKRKILVCAVCFTIAGIYANAQTKSTIGAPPPPAPPLVVLAPPPAPPLPPPPPAPSIPPAPPYGNLKGIEIINSNGYDICIRHIKGTDFVFAKKDTKTQKIKLSTWNTSRKYYEKKYGHLPPPPPPPEELMFTPPAIIQDIH